MCKTMQGFGLRCKIMKRYGMLFVVMVFFSLQAMPHAKKRGRPRNRDCSEANFLEEGIRKRRAYPLIENLSQFKAFYAEYLQRHATKGEEISCPSCEYSTLRAVNLRLHIMRMHIKPYRCLRCEGRCLYELEHGELQAFPGAVRAYLATFAAEPSSPSRDTMHEASSLAGIVDHEDTFEGIVHNLIWESLGGRPRIELSDDLMD